MLIWGVYRGIWGADFGVNSLIAIELLIPGNWDGVIYLGGILGFGLRNAVADGSQGNAAHGKIQSSASCAWVGERAIKSLPAEQAAGRLKGKRGVAIYSVRMPVTVRVRVTGSAAR
jgi:hypothetical protein